ncbi:MAG: membrane protein insertion efficiency factor YidD [Opitutae bacterium]|nr:membrane protein insertion efficiency factor YidD [Opitutae bacterium]
MKILNFKKVSSLSVFVIFFIKVYQFFSPLKQALFGPYARCRFHPTCSQYALDCFRGLSFHKACRKAFSRFIKCNPLHPGGYDPLFKDCKSCEQEMKQ